MDDDALRGIFARTKTIAVLGLHDDPSKAARGIDVVEDRCALAEHRRLATD